MAIAISVGPIGHFETASADEATLTGSATEVEAVVMLLYEADDKP